jgi:VIT1/CCC1 family predicted Fe2+/Mn2+ transporter
MRENPAGAIYGTITFGALLAAETSRRETYPRTIVALVLALVLYWLAHAYSRSAGTRLQQEEPLTLAGVIESMVHELPILSGACVPLAVIVICGIGGVSLDTGLKAAVWATAIVLVAIEVISAVRAEVKGRGLAIQIAVGVCLGLLVIAINAVLH